MKKHLSFLLPLALSTIACACAAAASPLPPPGTVIPVEEWTWIPTWSPDGQSVAVQWPAPPLIGPDGKLQRDILKTKGKARMIAYPAPATLLNSKSQQVGILSTSD